MIRDSGERTEFPSGAVRDLHEGKGRFDLLPMCVLIRLAKHYEAGALKYSDRNWEKGIPAHSFADSALRHLVKYLDGQNDEDHLIAAIWNLCGLAWTEERRPDMMDIPAVIASHDIRFELNENELFNNHKRDINSYNGLMKSCFTCSYHDPLRHACNHIGECDAYKAYLRNIPATEERHG